MLPRLPSLSQAKLAAGHGLQKLTCYCRQLPSDIASDVKPAEVIHVAIWKTQFDMPRMPLLLVALSTVYAIIVCQMEPRSRSGMSAHACHKWMVLELNAVNRQIMENIGRFKCEGTRCCVEGQHIGSQANQREVAARFQQVTSMLAFSCTDAR